MPMLFPSGVVIVMPGQSLELTFRNETFSTFLLTSIRDREGYRLAQSPQTPKDDLLKKTPLFVIAS